MAKDTTGRLRVTVKSGGRLKLSSKLWLERQLNDPYVAQAKRDGLRSRAAYKLIEIDDKHHFLKMGASVVDLGAAPGGWSQIAARRVGAADGKGKVVAIDLLEMPEIAGVTFAQLDFLKDDAPKRLIDMKLDGKSGFPDGLRVDTDGNIWVGAGWVGDGYDGVQIFAPDGARIGQILLPETCANVCFGGKKRNRLFMTASQSLYAVYVETQGAHFC